MELLSKKKIGRIIKIVRLLGTGVKVPLKKEKGKHKKGVLMVREFVKAKN